MAPTKAGKDSTRIDKQEPGTMRTREMVEHLERDDHRLSAPLLDAAVSGIVLGFHPFDLDTRIQAAHAWEAIRTVLAKHLLEEDENLLPWLKTQQSWPAEFTDTVKRRCDELQALVPAIDSVSFEDGDDVSVAKAGKALCLLAMKIDDLVACEENRLIPLLRHLIFASQPSKNLRRAGFD